MKQGRLAAEMGRKVFVTSFACTCDGLAPPELPASDLLRLRA